MDGLTDWLSSVVVHHPTEAYLFLLLSAVVENVFPPFPGDAMMVFGGYLVGRGALDFWVVVGITVAGHILGFTALVLVGRTVGRAALARLHWGRRAEGYIDRAERHARRHGMVLIIVSRFLPGVRSVVSIVAGLVRMPVWQIALTATVSIATWNYLLIWGGRHIGENWERVVELLNQYSIVVGSVLVVAALGAGIWSYGIRRRNRQGQ